MKNYSEETCVYLLYPNLENPTHVFYLDKFKPKKPNLPVNGKYLGYGGDIKRGEDIYDSVIRELKEELGIRVSKDYLRYQGKLIRQDQNLIIYILKIGVERIIPDAMHVKDEGFNRIRDINFHKRLENREHFVACDYQFLDILFFSDESFEVLVDKDGKISRKVSSRR